MNKPVKPTKPTQAYSPPLPKDWEETTYCLVSHHNQKDKIILMSDDDYDKYVYDTPDKCAFLAESVPFLTLTRLVHELIVEKNLNSNDITIGVGVGAGYEEEFISIRATRKLSNAEFAIEQAKYTTEMNRQTKLKSDYTKAMKVYKQQKAEYDLFVAKQKLEKLQH